MTRLRYDTYKELHLAFVLFSLVQQAIKLLYSVTPLAHATAGVRYKGKVSFTPLPSPDRKSVV